MGRVLFALIATAILTLLPRVALAKKKASIGDPLRIAVPGSPDAYYYKPRVRGQRPVIMYLHGRGGHPAEDCRKWARVGRAPVPVKVFLDKILNPNCC